MNHIILFFICILYIEVINRSNLLNRSSSVFKFYKEIIAIILNKKISDNQKGYLIPQYSIKIIKNCLVIFMIILLLIIPLIIINLFIDNFLLFIFSINTFFESLLFTLIYIFFVRRHLI